MKKIDSCTMFKKCIEEYHLNALEAGFPSGLRIAYAIMKLSKVENMRIVFEFSSQIHDCNQNLVLTKEAFQKRFATFAQYLAELDDGSAISWKIQMKYNGVAVSFLGRDFNTHVNVSHLKEEIVDVEPFLAEMEQTVLRLIAKNS